MIGCNSARARAIAVAASVAARSPVRAVTAAMRVRASSTASCGYQLMHDGERPLARSDIARDWYSRVYPPAVDVICAERFDGACPDATDSDKFLWLCERRRELAVAPRLADGPLPPLIRDHAVDGSGCVATTGNKNPA